MFRGILADAVNVLNAQRGVIALAEEPNKPLQPRAVIVGDTQLPANGGKFEKVAAQSCFSQSWPGAAEARQSLLCHKVSEDAELARSQNIRDGAMDSVLCVVLRTPRKRLGILHLDRGPFQERFTTTDLYLADAMAACVSAGIESAQLLRAAA